MFVAGVKFIYAAVLLLVAYGLPALELMIPREVSLGVIGAVILARALSLGKIITFTPYHAMYKEILFGSMVFLDPNVQRELQKKQDQKKISADTSIFSNKKGFEYLNELFIKRHRKILWSFVKKISVVSAVTYVACYVMMQLRLPTFAFGLATIAFCVLYSVLACLLVYKVAPRTFRIRS